METIKYKSVIITITPSNPHFPKMVTITKTSKKLILLKNKKYISIYKAIIAIDILKAENLIEKGRIRTEKDLMELGLGKTIRW